MQKLCQLPPSCFHEGPAYQNKKHPTDGKENQVIDCVIGHLPDIVNGEDLMVNDAFDEIEQPPAGVGEESI